VAEGEIRIKSRDEILLIAESARLVSATLAEVARHIRPGLSTQELDGIAEAFIRQHGGIPAFKGYHPDPADTSLPPFPASLCISLNEEVVHGIPASNRIIAEGDVVSVDCGIELHGYFGDSAYTFAVGAVPLPIQKLMQTTHDALYQGIKEAIAGNRVGAISRAVQRHIEKAGFGVVQEMVGHGVGFALHEPPEVPNHGWKWEGEKLREGMVIAIEPMTTLGRRHIRVAADQWTLLTRDGKVSAHYEHTIAIMRNKAEILSTFAPVEAAVSSNPHLSAVIDRSLSSSIH
jgi:methionyl aminopeptidase